MRGGTFVFAVGGCEPGEARWGAARSVALSERPKASRSRLSARHRIRGQASASASISHTKVWSRFAAAAAAEAEAGQVQPASEEKFPPAVGLAAGAAKLASASRI